MHTAFASNTYLYWHPKILSSENISMSNGNFPIKTFDNIKQQKTKCENKLKKKLIWNENNNYIDKSKSKRFNFDALHQYEAKRVRRAGIAYLFDKRKLFRLVKEPIT